MGRRPARQVRPHVTADEANRILMIFAGMVAAGYVVAQVMLAIAYYGRDRKGLVKSAKINWSLAVRGARAFFARKRRGVYREKKVVEYVPTPSGPAWCTSPSIRAARCRPPKSSSASPH